MTRQGFTLVELMIVVAIISVLAVIAGTAYRRYMDSGRVAEVYSMLAEIRIKQEAFKVENPAYRSANAAESDFFPALSSTAGVEPHAHAVTSPPQWWTDLGISPAKSSLYCSYTTVAGAKDASPTGARGLLIFPGTPPAIAWWYAIGTCDNDSDGNSAHNAYFTTSSQTSTVSNENEHW